MVGRDGRVGAGLGGAGRAGQDGVWWGRAGPGRAGLPTDQTADAGGTVLTAGRGGSESRGTCGLRRTRTFSTRQTLHRV